MAQTTITFRIDEDTKNQLNEICEALGMTISGALTICSKMIVNKGGLPFEVKLDRANLETLKVLQEVKEGKNLSKEFNSVAELMEDLDA